MINPVTPEEVKEARKRHIDAVYNTHLKAINKVLTESGNRDIVEYNVGADSDMAKDLFWTYNAIGWNVTLKSTFLVGGLESFYLFFSFKDTKHELRTRNE